MQVLVTGASGFVGREVAKCLISRGYEVHTLGRTSSPVSGVVHHTVDLLAKAPDLRAIGADKLIHCAWYAEPGQFWTSPRNLDWVAASLQLFRNFSSSGGKRLVVAGSCAEYAWDRSVFRESDTHQLPSTLYGVAKRALWEVTDAASNALSLSVGWGRIFMPYGSHEDARRLLGTVINARRSGTTATFTDGRQVRDFIHVEDVAGALVALMESPVEGAVNVGSGLGVSVRDFINTAARIAGMNDRVEIGARPDRPGDPPSIVADIGILKEQVGYVPHYDLEAGLMEALL